MEKIDLISLERTRKNIIMIERSMKEMARKMQSLIDEKSQVQKSCNHVLGVNLREYNIEDSWVYACCLNCNRYFTGQEINNSGFFQNAIHFEELAFDGVELEDEIKVEIALEMFRQERVNHPELSDAEIVAIINEQIKYQTTPVKEQNFVKSIGSKNQQ